MLIAITGFFPVIVALKRSTEMKNFIYMFVAMLLGIVVVFGVFNVMQEDNISADSSLHASNSLESSEFFDCSTSESFDIKNSDLEQSDSSSGDIVEEVEALKNPENVSSYIADGLQMRVGAQLFLNEDRPRLAFVCDRSDELYEEVLANTNKKVVAVIAPLEYFDEVNRNNYTYIDWITTFEREGKPYIYLDDFEGDLYRANISNVKYSNINRKFVGLFAIEITNSDGSRSYQYAAFPDGEDYRSNARSVAYVAASSLNAHALGIESFPEGSISVLKGYINESVDNAYGKTEATDDDSMYIFTVDPASPKSLSIGQTFKVSVEVLPNLDIPIGYRSSDESIVEVDSNGFVTAKAKGTVVVGVYVAGEAYGITVKVS